jgi:hypothetical protein
MENEIDHYTTKLVWVYLIIIFLQEQIRKDKLYLE